MKRISKIVLIAAILLMAAGLAACSREEQGLIGRWQGENGVIYEFMPDGSMTAYFAGDTVGGIWATREGGRLIMFVGGEPDNPVSYRVDGDILTFSIYGLMDHPQFPQSTFTRIE